MDPEQFHQRVLSNLQMLPHGSSIGVAVSGGADSVALFRAIHALACALHWSVIVLHINHKLRGQESDDDADFVQHLASALDTPCHVAQLPLTDQGNLEQAARIARNSWFIQMQQSHSLHKVAQGHTRSDQAETVLFRLLRGTGSAGLSGIRPTTTTGFVRPLLQITRQQTREYLHNIAQPWREDSSNLNLSFDRNRIRLELLPSLARDWNPQIETTLASVADWAQAEEEYWGPVIAALAARLITTANPAQLCTTDALTALPLATARRLVRHTVSLVRGDLSSINFAHVETILSLATQPEGSGRLQVPGVDVMRSFNWLRFAPPGTYSRDRHWSSPAPIPSEIPLQGGISTLLLQLRDVNYSYNGEVNCLDRARLPDSLELRTWQPGDQYRPLSQKVALPLKSLFQDARVPLWDRNRWPVLAAGETIVWTRQFGVATEFAAGPSTKTAVLVEEIPTPAPKTSLLEKHLETGIVRLLQ